LRFRIGIALSLRHWHSFRQIRFEVLGGVATLRGEVPSFYERQVAVETIRRVAGVRRIHDELAVAAAGQSVDRRESQGELLSQATMGDSSLVSAKKTIALETAEPSRGITVPFLSGFHAPVKTLMLIVSLTFATLVGCGKNSDRVQVFPVEGQVTLNGHPLANAFVVLHPKDANASGVPAARAQTDSNGTFRASTYEADDGAAVGEYAVTIEYYQPIDNGNGSSEPGPNVLPARLGSPQTTEHVLRVTANPNKFPPIEVSR
jgi:hypothetical protein